MKCNKSNASAMSVGAGVSLRAEQAGDTGWGGRNPDSLITQYSCCQVDSKVVPVAIAYSTKGLLH